MYSSFPGLPWYPALQIFVISLAAGTVIALCKDAISKSIAFLLAIYFVVFATSLPNFTIAASLMIGYSVWIGLKILANPYINHWLTLAVSIFVGLVGIFTRSDVLLLALAVFFPAIVYISVNSSKRKT